MDQNKAKSLIRIDMINKGIICMEDEGHGSANITLYYMFNFYSVC